MELAQTVKKEFRVVGSKRSVPEQKIENLEIIPLDINKDHLTDQLENLLEADIVLLNIPPSSGTSKEDFIAKSKTIIDQAKKKGVEHFIFISSTGVFSNDQHDIDENTPPEPETPNGLALAELEAHIAASNFSHKHIIRPGGLVGGSRHPAFYIAGRSDVSGRNHPVNLVHRIDLIGITRLAILQKPGQLILHAVAPKHISKESYYVDAAKFFNLEPPVFSKDSSRGKKIHSAITSEILNFKYNYPSPIDMLSSIRRS